MVIELRGDLSTEVVPGNDSCRPTQLTRAVCMGGGKSRAEIYTPCNHLIKVQGKLRLIDMLHVKYMSVKVYAFIYIICCPTFC